MVQLKKYSFELYSSVHVHVLEVKSALVFFFKYVVTHSHLSHPGRRLEDVKPQLHLTTSWHTRGQHRVQRDLHIRRSSCEQSL